MASIIKANINLNEIPKDKIYKGKKGNYLPITIQSTMKLTTTVIKDL